MHKLHLSKVQKFLFLIFILVAYTILMISKYGIKNGPLVSITTWCFFVFCTPIADAGFLIDFPIRILTKFKMFYSEIIVWIIAFSITFYDFFFNPEIFKNTGILKIYYHIITHLYPYGIIIILSAIGTFLSIYFGDEIYDNLSSKQKKRKKKKNVLKYIIFPILIILVIISYYFIIKNFHLNINLF